MPFPASTELNMTLLRLIGQSPDGRVLPKVAFACLAKYFKLTDDEYLEEYEGGDNKWRVLVAYARQNLVDQGWVSREERGVWKITDEGRRKLAQLGSQPLISCDPSPSAGTATTTQLATVDDIAASTYATRAELDSIRSELSQRVKSGTSQDLSAIESQVGRLASVTDDLRQQVTQLSTAVKDIEATLRGSSALAVIPRLEHMERAATRADEERYGEVKNKVQRLDENHSDLKNKYDELKEKYNEIKGNRDRIATYLLGAAGVIIALIALVR